ncbi:putative periplasmic binding protein-like I [Helianthus debilis subsp. tardiflorus]
MSPTLIFLLVMSLFAVNNGNRNIEIKIGVILDMDSNVGKMSKTCISMAIRDFYRKHDNYTTIIHPYYRDSKQDNVQAASAALDLMKNIQVTAIIGPMTSSQADFVIDLGNKEKVPVISPAASPSLSPYNNHYFIRSAHNSTLQLKPITELIKHFSWSEVVFMYEDGEYGRGLVPYLSDAMMNIGTKVTYQTVIYPSASDDWILAELYKLKTMQTRVFVVHALPDLALRLFKKVNEAGMMDEGYVWFITEGLTNQLHDHKEDLMQGVIGVKSFIRNSGKLFDFKKRWKREFRSLYPDDDETQLDTSGIRLYDTIFGLAMALEKTLKEKGDSAMDSEGTRALKGGSMLLQSIRNFRFDGLSGWEIPVSNKNMLRVGVRIGGFDQFIDADIDPETHQVTMTGFCVDVFKAVVDALPYALKFEFVRFVSFDDKRPAGTFDDLVFNLSIGGYDAVVGDITILAYRSDRVAFTLPYTEAGVSLVVPIKDERKSAWIFLKPLEKELWITFGAFFIYTGLVVWVIEHRVNEEFRGAPHKQVGMLLYNSFSTLVYSHRARLISNLSRFVMIVWVFVVLVLTSSYTASLTSMLTVQKLRPTYTDINEIKRNGESIGYQDGSFVKGMLIRMGFNDTQLKGYSTFEQYHDALKNGSQNGGVSAIMEELPYIRVFVAKYCNMYKMTGPVHKTAGFGFAFPKGSPLVHDVSKAILQVTEKQMMNITNHWFKENANCDQQQKGTQMKIEGFGLDSFKGVFLIAGLSSTSALLIFVFRFLYQNREMLVSQDHSVSQKLLGIAKSFDVYRDEESKTSIPEATGVHVESNNNNNSPAISVFHQEAGVFSQDEGFSSTHPGSPVVLDTIQVVQTTTN